MQMTYLTLCQYAHRFLRAGNSQGGTQPSVIPVTTGDQVVFDIVAVMPAAWEWVQDQHESWDFMRKQGQLALTNGQRAYTLAQIQVLIPDYYKIIPFWAASQTYPYFLMFDSNSSTKPDFIYPFVEYMDWRGWWDRNPRPTSGQPNRMTERPDKTLEFDPAPLATSTGGVWTVKFDYRIKNQVLSASGDIPILPPEFHELIAWVAIRMICDSRMNSGPLQAAADQRISNYMGQLKSKYLPQIQVDMSYA